MNIKLNNIGKRYNYEWIFRNVDLELGIGENCVILGSNGSGKSTLLQVLCGSLTHSEGNISYRHNDKEISDDDQYQLVSIAAPYLDLFEEFTLAETIDFQSKFKPFQNSLSTKEIIALMQLENASNKQLKYFSSGMKQRVRLALAILADTPLLLLDEPTSNLDKKAVTWYQELTTAFSKHRLIIVASNQQEQEYPFCTRHLNIEDYKTLK